MICKFCGKEISDNSTHCSICGNAVTPNPTPNQPTPNPENFTQNGYYYGTPYYPVKQEKCGQSIASLVLGLVGLVAWILPILGFPVTITGLALGVAGQKKGGKGMATAGIVLCIITLVLTAANSALGAYIGYHNALNQYRTY